MINPPFSHSFVVLSFILVCAQPLYIYFSKFCANVSFSAVFLQYMFFRIQQAGHPGDDDFRHSFDDIWRQDLPLKNT